MSKATIYETAGAIGLCSYVFTGLVCYGHSKLPMHYKWIWHGEDMFKWVCLLLFILMNFVVLAAFIELLRGRGWNKGNWLVVVDGLFFVITIVYILFWLLLLVLLQENSHYVF